MINWGILFGFFGEFLASVKLTGKQHNLLPLQQS